MVHEQPIPRAATRSLGGGPRHIDGGDGGVWVFLLSPRLYDSGLSRPRADGTKVIDRIQITATAKPTRWLLVTIYRNPGDVSLDRYLSRELMSPYWVRGKSEDVARLLGAAEGAEIKGTFVVYTGGSPWLLIAQLDLPPETISWR